MTLLIACGLKREARIIARMNGNAIVIVGGGQSEPLERELADAAERSPGIILSFGLAGALDPTLLPGDLVIDGEPALLGRLALALPKARIGKIVGSNAIVESIQAKAALANKTDGIAVDMETHIAARVAARRSLPFGVIRAIADTADETLPAAALVGMRPNGGMALGSVFASLLRHPGQLPALMRTGSHAKAGFRALSDGAKALGDLTA